MKRTLGLLFTLVTINPPAFANSSDSARQIAERSAAQWNAAFAAGKVDAILSLYSEDAMLLEPNGLVAKGSGQIRSFWSNMIQQGEYAMDIVDVHGEQDGTIVATAKLSDVKTLENTQETIRYHYQGLVYNVLRQQADGSWKAEVQRWNSERKT